MNLRALALLATVIALPAVAQTPYLVSDLNTTSGEGARSSSPHTFAVIGGTLHIGAETGALGQELWKYSGGVLSLFADIAPGTASSSPRLFTDIGGGVSLFQASHPAYGRELWRTDGTAAGTSLVKDIHPTGNGFSATMYAVFGGRLFFVGNDGVHGAEPWFSDGTEAGTQMLRDLDGASTSSSPTVITVLGDKLLLFGANGLWTSDGTTAGTTLVATVGNAAWLVGRIGTTLFFSATGTGGTGRELWKSDGTTEGTQMVADIIPGPTSGLTTEAGLVTIGSTLYFAARRVGGGVELWKSDGTSAGTQFIKLLSTNPSESAYDMIVVGSTILFQLEEGLWRSDGTAAGTYVLDSATISPGWPIDSYSGVLSLVAAFGRAYYVRPGPAGGELWSTDGSTTAFVASTREARNLTWIGGKLYFSAFDTLTGHEPWVSEDGTGATTHRLVNIEQDLAPSSFPNTLTAAGNFVFFRAYDGFSKNDIWRSDGTSGGTFRVTSMSSGPNSEAPVSLLTGWNGALYFKRLNMELWRSSGTVAGTALLKDFSSAGGYPFSRMFAGSQYLFLDANRYSAPVLWRTDGTTAGTITLGDLLPNYQYPSYPTGFAELAGRVYVSAGDTLDGGLWVTEGTPATTKKILSVESSDPVTTPVASAGAIFYLATTASAGTELWRSDGRGGSEVLVKDIAPGATSSSPTTLTSSGRFLFFVANDGTTGAELWRTDGTTPGTILLADIAAGTASSAPANLKALGQQLYFTANDGTHGVELWRSDGTPAGTVMVADLRPGSDSADPTWLQVAGGSLWFSANDGVNGQELWRLTLPATLTMVADLAPGSASSQPTELVSTGQLLYFAATTSLGRELWAVPLTGPTLRIGDVRMVEGTGGTRTMRFTVTRDGTSSAAASAAFTTMNGTASSGADYVANSGIVSFASGQTSQFIDVVVQADAVAEENEALLVLLSSPSGASLANSVATGVIEDDDHRADLSIVALDPDPNETFPSNSDSDFLITNTGPSAATDLRVRFSESPQNMELALGYGCLSADANPITCNFESLAAGATLGVRVHVGAKHGQVTGAVQPGATITASVSAAEPDDNLSNNTAARMQSQDGRIIAPAFLTSGSTATVRVSNFYLNSTEVLATLTSNVPGVVVTPASVVIPPQQRFATFTLTVGAYTGPVKLTATPAAYEGTAMTVYVVAPGAQPKLDTAIDAKGSSVTYGDPATITVNVAARRHDGTLPTGLVSLLDQNWNVVAEQPLDAGATTIFTRNGLLPGNTIYYLRYHGDANFNAMEYAQTGVSVGGWQTTLLMDVPPLMCASPTQQDIVMTVRTSQTTNAPTGSLEVTVGSTVVANLTLAPTGVPGESRATLHWSFAAGDFYISTHYVPTGTFADSYQGQHFLTVSCVPLNVQATGTSASSISVTWTALAGADHYDVVRSVNRDSWGTIGATTSTAMIDTDHSWTRAYLYTVRAFDAANNVIGWGAPDLAMNMTFTDDPIIPGVTPVRAAHVQQLRIAANALRWFGVNADVTIVTPVPVGSLIRLADVTELRSDITTLGRSLGLATIPFASPTLTIGNRIKAIDIQELRNAVK